MPAVTKVPKSAKCRLCGEELQEGKSLAGQKDIIYIYRNAIKAKHRNRHLFIHKACYDAEQIEIKRRNEHVKLNTNSSPHS